MVANFYMDEHVPGPVTVGLRSRGVDVVTVQEDLREGDNDSLLLDRATELNRVLVSRDRDFYAIVAARQSSGIAFRGVISLSPKIGYRQAIDELEMIAKCSEIEEWDNQITRVPLG